MTVDKNKQGVARLLRISGGYFGTAGAFSLAINLLYLAGPLYMLQVYDRVVPSSSQVTLLMLTVGLLLAFLAMAGLDAVRARVLTRASVRLDRRIAPRILTAIVEGPLGAAGAHSQFTSTACASSSAARASTRSSICRGRRSTSP
jgi:ATP-binding cassette, subfamily C, type I secretion system permease/ATPase